MTLGHVHKVCRCSLGGVIVHSHCCSLQGYAVSYSWPLQWYDRRMEPGMESLTVSLTRLEGKGEVYRALHTILHPIAEYDARTSSDLGLTLRAYVHAGGNLNATAERLFLHRNSVAYRLQRIQDLSGIDLRDQETRLRLMVALAVADPSAFRSVSAKTT